MNRVPHAHSIQSLFTILERHEVAQQKLTRHHLARGDVLITQGEDAEELFLVETGRLSVERNGVKLAEIGAGTPVGEIAFFTGAKRTATVAAARNSVVLQLSRPDYHEICAKSPEFSTAIARLLAQRLANTSAKVVVEKTPPLLRTITLLATNNAGLPKELPDAIAKSALTNTSVVVIKHNMLPAHLAGDLNGPDAAKWFNDHEREGNLVIFIADPDHRDWSRRVIGQSDQLLLIATAGSVQPLSELEEFAFKIIPETQRRLALIHPPGTTTASGTSEWLNSRPVFMHHHLAEGYQNDIDRLARFLTGHSRGLVAGGGGALGALHTGTYEGLRKGGISFDIFGGTSVGAAMCGAFAMGLSGDEIDRRTGEIFVKGKALATFTVPRYSLLDHTVFDARLREHYTDVLIEDLWFPYFAVATDLSDNTLKVIRRGPLWQAIRASAAIPGALPPFFDGTGSMFADGGAVDNLPYRTMHELKSGPNVVISFARDGRQVFDVDYDALPGRGRLLRRFVWPFGKKPPRAPGLVGVVMRAIMARQAGEPLDLAPTDWLIRPEVPRGAGFMAWKLHNKLFASARDAVPELLAAPVSDDEARAAFVAMSNTGSTLNRGEATAA